MRCSTCGNLYTRASTSFGLCWNCARAATRGDHSKPIGAVIAKVLTKAAPTVAPDQSACTCSRCKGKYANPILADGICWNCRDAERDQARREAEFVRAAGIPIRHSRFVFWEELFGPEAYNDAVALVQEFVEHGSSVLGMIGGRGGGKTQVMAVAIREVIRYLGRPARYTTALGLLADLKRRYAQRGVDADAAWLDEWTRPYLLCIDEIGERADSDHTKTMLTALVDARYAKMRPTLLAGNVAADQWAACVGDSIADRANEGGGIIEFTGWPSFRTTATREGDAE